MSCPNLQGKGALHGQGMAEAILGDVRAKFALFATRFRESGRPGGD